MLTIPPQSCLPNPLVPNDECDFNALGPPVRIPNLQYRKHGDETVPATTHAFTMPPPTRSDPVVMSSAAPPLLPSRQSSMTSNGSIPSQTPPSTIITPPIDLGAGKKKKKGKSGLASFFSAKEPSTSAFAEYQDEQRRLVALKGSKAVVGLPGVSTRQLPDHVPKVNSKWDGLPAAVHSPGKTSIGGDSNSSGGTDRTVNLKSLPTSPNERRSGSNNSSSERSSTFSKRSSRDRPSRSSAFERPNGALQLYGQPTSPYGKLARGTPPISPSVRTRFAGGTSPASIPSLLRNRSSGDVSKLELQASPASEGPPSIDEVHASPELPPKIPDEIVERYSLSSTRQNLETKELSPATSSDGLPITPTSPANPNGKDIPHVVPASPGGEPRLQWPLDGSMTKPIFLDSGLNVVGPLPARSTLQLPSTDGSSSLTKNVKSLGLAPDTKAVGFSACAVTPPDSPSPTLAQKPRNFARPFTGLPTPPSTASPTNSYFPPNAADAVASMAGPARQTFARNIGRSVTKDYSLPPIQEVDGQSIISSARDRSSHIIIDSSSDEDIEDDQEEERARSDVPIIAAESQQGFLSVISTINEPNSQIDSLSAPPPSIARWPPCQSKRSFDTLDDARSFLVSDDGTPFRYKTYPASTASTHDNDLVRPSSSGASSVSTVNLNSNVPEDLDSTARSNNEHRIEPDSRSASPSPTSSEIESDRDESGRITPTAQTSAGHLEHQDASAPPSPSLRPHAHAHPSTEHPSTPMHPLVSSSSRTSISSELSVRHYQSPRERLGLGGFIKHDRSGGVPWPTDLGREDPTFVVGESVRASREEVGRRREQKLLKERKAGKILGVEALAVGGSKQDSGKRKNSGGLGWGKAWGRR